MRKPTKVALNYLAEMMVENGSYIDTRGTGDFINEAVRLHKKTDSYVTVETIKKHESDLEKMCQAKMLDKYPLKKDIVVPKQFDDDVDSTIEENVPEEELEWFYDYYGDPVDDNTIVKKAFSIVQDWMNSQDSTIEDDDFDYTVEKQQSFNQQIGNLILKNVNPVKNYSIFIEGEDGLRVIRGSYKGLYVSEIDRKQWVGCAAGWSRKMLNDNEQLGASRPGALTEDDKNVFLDIISGKDV